jgi:hypothetical protein
MLCILRRERGLRAAFDFVMESLILAQNERWRHGLGMQVERDQ